MVEQPSPDAAVGRRVDRGADDPQVAQALDLEAAAAIGRRDDAVGVVREAREDGDLVPLARELVGELEDARLGRADLRVEVVREEQDAQEADGTAD